MLSARPYVPSIASQGLGRGVPRPPTRMVNEERCCPAPALGSSRLGPLLGGDGTAAILGMLQTCSPGLAVVNVDNGVGAGATAALIANRAAAPRTTRENG